MAGVIEQPRDGFSGIYHKVPDLSALFYSVIGIFFLYLFLSGYYKQHIVIATLIILFFGTNVYYYAIDNTGMSHIYSFSLFAALAWVTKKMLDVKKENQFKYFIIWSLLFAMTVLVRPTNIIILPFLFTLDFYSLREFWIRVKEFVKVKYVLVAATAFLIIFLPQFIYWKYVSGSYFFYSYGEYGFSNLTSPKIPELLFSPNNGLFLYNPLYLIVLAAIVVKIVHQRKSINDWVILGTFLILIYVFASWFLFYFGCSFGSRNFVEYTVMFALPFGYLLHRSEKWVMLWRLPFVMLICILVFFNLRLIKSYDKCFQGGDWEFHKFTAYFIKNIKYRMNLELTESDILILPEMEFSKTLSLHTNRVNHLNYSKAYVTAEIKVEANAPEAMLVLAVESPDSLIYWNSGLLKDYIPKRRLNRKHKVEAEFWLPVPLPENSTIVSYIWNKNNEQLILYELELALE